MYNENTGFANRVLSTRDNPVTLNRRHIEPKAVTGEEEVAQTEAPSTCYYTSNA